MKEQILKKLKNLRIKADVKPAVLANHLGIDESTYNRMENGTNDTWGDYLFDLLQYYKINPSQFFQDIEGKNFIHQNIKEIKDHASGTLIVETINYSDKPMVKSMFN